MNKTVKIVMALIGVMFILGAVMLPAFADAEKSLIAPATAANDQLIAPASEKAVEEAEEAQSFLRLLPRQAR